MTWGGVPGVAVIRRMAEAKPSAWTVSVTSGRSGATKRPVWNRPCSSVLSRTDDPEPCRPENTTAAPATGRPVGLITVPVTAAPAFITWTLDSLRASSAVIRDSTAKWSGCVNSTSSRLSGPAVAGRASDRHRPSASVRTAATSSPRLAYIAGRPGPGPPGLAKTRAPAIGRPCSSRTTPPIVAPRGIASV